MIINLCHCATPAKRQLHLLLLSSLCFFFFFFFFFFSIFCGLDEDLYVFW